jgi:hypothetical protein
LHPDGRRGGNSSAGRVAPDRRGGLGKRARAYDASGVFAGRLAAVDLERGSRKIRRVFLRKGHLAKSKVAVSAPELLGAADDLVTLGSVAA